MSAIVHLSAAVTTILWRILMIWLFDIDGTLIHAGGAGSQAMAQALSHEFGVETDLRDIAFAGRTDFAITTDLFLAHQVEFTSQNVNAFYTAYLQQLPQALATRDGLILPGVIRWLDYLTDQPECFLGLLTGNMKAAAKLKLQHFELWHYFDFGAYGDHHLHRNDVSADAVSAAAVHTRNDVNPQHVWAVGDTPSDIECARSQGAKSIAVATGSHSQEQLMAYEPDVLLADLSDDSLLRRVAMRHI